MKKGSAMEGFIREDGTIRPIEHYDDTKLRDKIHTNTANISNIDSRVTELEEHGGVEDQTKADKVENATAGNLASLDENGNLQDSGKKPADFAPSGHSHNAIMDASTESSISIDEGVISFTIEGAGSGGETEINADNIGNLHRALQDPVKNSDPDSAYSNNKLITAAAVLHKISGKLNYPDVSLMVKFDVSGGALTLVSDTTEYNNIFGLVEPGVTKIVTTFVGIFNSDDDVYTKFFGVASVSGQYSNIDGTLEKIMVTIYVGGYTIHLEKNVLTDDISVSMDSFAALLQNS